MRNYEFYKEEIEMRYRNGESFALTKQDCIASCKIIDCEECAFSCCNNPQTRELRCGDRKLIWAMQEYIEKPKLNKYERALCEAMQKGWVARDAVDGFWYMYDHEPTKCEQVWRTIGRTITQQMRLVDASPEIQFSFIKWEDEKPWSIEELLKLEVEE